MEILAGFVEGWWCGCKAMAYPEVICCVVEEGVRCGVIAGCTTFDRRWLKNVSQRRQRYLADPEVSSDRRVFTVALMLN